MIAERLLSNLPNLLIFILALRPTACFTALHHRITNPKEHRRPACGQSQPALSKTSHLKNLPPPKNDNSPTTLQPFPQSRGATALYATKTPTHRIMKTKFTAILRFEEDAVVALSPELDIASQGSTPQEALANLKEAVELYLETAPPAELEGRLSEESWITQFETEYAPT